MCLNYSVTHFNRQISCFSRRTPALSLAKSFFLLSAPVAFSNRPIMNSPFHHRSLSPLSVPLESQAQLPEGSDNPRPVIFEREHGTDARSGRLGASFELRVEVETNLSMYIMAVPSSLMCTTWLSKTCKSSVVSVSS